jgi:dTDP-4-dehydrorhamnose 3,5-epimerase
MRRPPADWRGARVLVTGARGFIASHLCDRLIASGATVFGVSSRSSVTGSPALAWLQADLGDAAQVRAVMERAAPDTVFHLAGHVSGAQALDQVQATFVENLTSTVNLLAVATERGSGRLVLTGSMQEPDLPDDPGIPCSPYAASKFAARAYARMFHALYQLPIVIARPMMVYGPRQWDTKKLLPYVATALLTGESPLIGSGTRELDWVFVDDAVDGLMTTALAPEIDGLTVDLGSGTLTTVRTVVEKIAALVGGATPIRFRARGRDGAINRMARHHLARRGAAPDRRVVPATMLFTETSLSGAFVIDIERHEDSRGFFARSWCRREFEAHGLNPCVVQCNVSRNRSSGTLRGLHYQIAPHEEAKLVRCTRGAIYDVIVDLRDDSRTYLRHFGAELTEDNHRSLYIPEGFAHGFMTLTDEAEVAYQMSAFYVPDAARGIRWNDPALAIGWPAPVRVISDRDRSYPDLQPKRTTETAP